MPSGPTVPYRNSLTYRNAEVYGGADAPIPPYYSTPVTAYELHQAVCVKAGYTLAQGAVAAANHLAGTTGKEMVEALNILAGNAKSQYRELGGVLNQLAGTTELDAQGAASRWAGR